MGLAAVHEFFKGVATILLSQHVMKISFELKKSKTFMYCS